MDQTLSHLCANVEHVVTIGVLSSQELDADVIDALTINYDFDGCGSDGSGCRLIVEYEIDVG